MDRLAAVRFDNVGKYYYFSTNLDLHKGDKVVVETIRGLELGELISELKEMSEFKLNKELKPIIRLANRADLEIYDINKIKAEQSFDICKDIIEESGLDMRLINCEYTLDASKVIFMYTADERVDFRELLKKLAGAFKCRIELRQVGPRDKAKVIGGLGTCGLPLCCSRFLGEFDGVSINMAKNQLLAINIDKISGACGRLLCCLKFEDEAYSQIKKKFPKIGVRIEFNGKMVKVVGLNVISDLVKIDDEGSISFVTLDEVINGGSITKEVPPEPKPKKEKLKEKDDNPKKPRNKNGRQRKQSKPRPQKQIEDIQEQVRKPNRNQNNRRNTNKQKPNTNQASKSLKKSINKKRNFNRNKGKKESGPRSS